MKNWVRRFSSLLVFVVISQVCALGNLPHSFAQSGTTYKALMSTRKLTVPANGKAGMFVKLYQSKYGDQIWRKAFLVSEKRLGETG